MKKSNKLKAIIVCHGKSEIILCSNIKDTLRLPISIESNNNGNSSIQITSINKFLEANKLSSVNQLINKYDDKIYHYKKVISGLKIFIVMDIDEPELTKEMIEDYKTGNMFKKYNINNLIIPIYNDKNLDEVLNSIGYKIDIKNKAFSYRKIFKKDRYSIDSFIELKDRINKTNKSNMKIMINYLDKVSKK